MSTYSARMSPLHPADGDEAGASGRRERLDPTGHSELPVDVAEKGGDGALAHPESVADLSRGETLRRYGEDLLFTLGQRPPGVDLDVDRVGEGAQVLIGQAGQHQLAPGRRPKSVEELVGVGVLVHESVRTDEQRPGNGDP